MTKLTEMELIKASKEQGRVASPSIGHKVDVAKGKPLPSSPWPSPEEI